MKFRLYTEYGALNSPPIFNALSQGLKKIGHEIVDSDGDIAVIWSVLWNGRMQPNKEIFYRYRKNNQPVLIIEVGNLKRNHTWRLSLNHVNSLGHFGNDKNIDFDRNKKLDIYLDSPLMNRREHILIACQHEKSLQWERNPPTSLWLLEKISEIRKFSDRKIIVRPHPRARFDISNITKLSNVEIQNPTKITGTYDDFNIDYNYHVLINHNSGPAIQSLIKGTPVICDVSSLAYPLSTQLKDIETCNVPDREDWFIRLCHTEWTVEEIKSGIPLIRILQDIEI